MVVTICDTRVKIFASKSTYLKFIYHKNYFESDEIFANVQVLKPK